MRDYVVVPPRLLADKKDFGPVGLESLRIWGVPETEDISQKVQRNSYEDEAVHIHPEEK